jgi:SAM-dependent methyltransferase
MKSFRKYTLQNRLAWDEIAQVRYDALSPKARYFAGGSSTLDRRAVAALGDVTGKTLLHLQCATGEETLSWSILGAAAVGVDISPRQIEIARQMALDAGLDTRFMAADVYDLPAELLSPGFDIVYTGGGVLVWLPDLDVWARMVASAMKPGGIFLLLEEHPIQNSLQVVDGELSITADYFRRSHPWKGSGWAHFKGGEGAHEIKYEFAWPLGDVVTALAASGLRIQRLVEYPTAAEWRTGAFAAQTTGLPGQYLLTAVKE